MSKSTTDSSNVTMCVTGPPKVGKGSLIVTTFGANALYLTPKASGIIEAGKHFGLDLTDKVRVVESMADVHKWVKKMEGKGVWVVVDDVTVLMDAYVRKMTIKGNTSVWDAYREIMADTAELLLKTVRGVEGLVVTNWEIPPKYNDAEEVTTTGRPLVPGLLMPEKYPGLFDVVVRFESLNKDHDAWGLRHPTHPFCLQVKENEKYIAATRLTREVETYAPLSMRELLIHCGRDVPEPWPNHEKAVLALAFAEDVREVFAKVQKTLTDEQALTALADARARVYYKGLKTSRAGTALDGLEL